MRWGGVASPFGREPLRSRALIVAVGVLSAAFAAAGIATDGRSWWALAWIGTWIVLGLATFTVAISASVRAIRRASSNARPTRFVVTRGAFTVPPLDSPVIGVISTMVITAIFLRQVVRQWRTVDDPDRAVTTLNIGFASVLTIMLLLTTLVLVATAVMVWRGLGMELTPTGVWWRGGPGRRLVPWESLAPGGPPRPRTDAKRLSLAVVRPELVLQRGWTIGLGNRQAPALPLQVDVHPWFLADAIRWYAEHPEDRAAIGTQAEHDRLVTALTGSPEGFEQPAEAVQGALARPPRPRVVAAAAWLTGAGVVTGLVAAVADLVVAIVFRDEFLAFDRAMDAANPSGDPMGGPAVGVSGADFVRAWAIGGLVLAVVAGVVAVALVRASMRGSDPARIGLVVLSGLVAAWATCPCGPPTVGMIGTSGGAILDGALLGLWVLERGVMLVLAIAVLVLLLLPASHRYFRPASSAQVPGTDQV
jgi:hypothetical protein